MKRLFAIVVLSIFLLNVLGYYGVLTQMKAVSEQKLSERLDSDMYDLGATVTFKVPFTLPYRIYGENFERVSGQFEKDGEMYQLVKQRLYQDTLYIVCVKDEKASRINDAVNDFVQSFAGQEDDSQQTVAPGLIKDYINYQISIVRTTTGWEKEIVPSSAVRSFIDTYSPSIIHPPDRA